MLVLIHHAMTDANEQNRMLGHTDSPLTEDGKKTCMSFRDDIGGHKYDAVFVSDLGRCQHTTELIIGQTHPREDWTLSEELRERSGGLLEGMTYQDIRKQFAPKHYKLWEREYFEAPPQGESFRDVEDRVLPFFKEYVQPLVDDGKNVWVCSSTVPMKILIGYLKGMDETAIMKQPIEFVMPYVLYGNIRT